MRACLVTASLQNVFFDEFAEAIEDILTAAGVAVSRSVDTFPEPEPDVVCLFVPHEYMALVQPESHPTALQLRRTVAICTEQPGTAWFDRAAAVSAACPAVLDINRIGVDELRRKGVGAELLPLGYVPRWDHWHGDAGAPRDIAVSFLGGHTDRRAAVLARAGAFLQAHATSIHLAETVVPHSRLNTRFLSGQRKWDVLRRTQVLLNVHRGELSYMEWLRTVQAVVNGAVVLTERCVAYDPFVPGHHFHMGSYERLHQILPAVLEDHERLDRMRTAAYELLADLRPPALARDALLAAIERARAEPGGRRPGDAPARPRPVSLVRPRPEVFTRPPSRDAAVAMGVKHLVLEHQALARALARVQGPVAEPPDRIEPAPAWAAARPRVSVVVTVYNYADYVGEALRSVALSEHDAYEVVIVDDASTDDSGDVIRRTLAEHHQLAAVTITRGRNQGLAASRNLGVEHARGELVFMLDADNAVYPRGLARLEDELRARPELAMAYGIIEQFDATGPRGLLSWMPWDPERLRYGNYIDAMAMIRRSALREVGGYDGSRALFGWEDFALWCAFADRGLEGALVAEILTRYRVGLASMISLANLDDAAAWGALTRRYAFLSGDGASS